MKIFNTINIIIKIVFILLVSFYFGLICKTKSICGHSFAIVIGNSMYPNLKDGDFLVVNQSSDYGINDIICFIDDENRKIVHRIIKMDGDNITTKGDFNTYQDNTITSKQVIGKVVYKSSFWGLVFSNVHIFIFGFILIILLMLKNFEKYDKIKL